MATESADPGRAGNQDGPVRAAIASLRRTADRHHPARMPGPHSVLDDCRSRDETSRFPTLLQRSPHAFRAGRTHARPECRPGPRPRDAQFVSLAGALSRAVSNTDRRVTDRPTNGLFEVRAVSIVWLRFSPLR